MNEIVPHVRRCPYSPMRAGEAHRGSLVVGLPHAAVVLVFGLLRGPLEIIGECVKEDEMIRS